MAAPSRHCTARVDSGSVAEPAPRVADRYAPSSAPPSSANRLPASIPASGRISAAAPATDSADPSSRGAVGRSPQTSTPSRPETMGAMRKPPTALAIGTMPSAAISAVIAPMISAVRRTSPARSPRGISMRRPLARARATAISPAVR